MCTIFTVCKNSEVFYCNNEDNQREPNETFIAFIPPQPIPSEWIFPDTTETLHSYGFVLVGVREGNILFPQGGMNEYGLAFDINFLPKMFFKGIDGKPWNCGFNFFDLLIGNRDISDLIDFFQMHKQASSQWDVGQIHFADSTGRAMITGITKEGELGFKFKEDKEYLISTNFSLLNPENKIGYPCQRYNTAKEMIEKLIIKEEISIEDLTKILDSVKLEFGILGPNTGTVYSNIYDLTRKQLYLYHWQDFSKVKGFDLIQKLKEVNTYSQEYRLADNTEKERFDFKKMQVYIIEELFE